MSRKHILLFLFTLNYFTNLQALGEGLSNFKAKHEGSTYFSFNENTTPPDSIVLWDDTPPFNNAGIPNEEEWRPDKSGVKKVSVPVLYPFLLDVNERRPAVIICPGGGYHHLAIKKEGLDVAQWFNEQGFHAFVLKYRLPNPKISNQQEMLALADSRRALFLLHEKASSWGIDTSRIGIMGFSAGGHLAASTSTLELEGIDDIFPDFSILIYPVISMEEEITHKGSRRKLLGDTPSQNKMAQFSVEQQITSKTPITFLLHSSDDQAVKAENSIRYYQALIQNGVEAELHLYQYGGHGYGMLPDKGYLSSWPERLSDWLKRNDLTP